MGLEEEVLSTSPIEAAVTETEPHPANRFWVGQIYEIDGQQWKICACDFIFDKAILRRGEELADPEIGYNGRRLELSLDVLEALDC